MPRSSSPRGGRGPRLSDLSVQTSRYGEQVPRIFGRMRVAGTVIWSTDLKESSATSGGGKGQAEPDQLQLLRKLCRGAFVAADQWDRADLGGRQPAARSAGDMKSPVGALRIHDGSAGQAVDSPHRGGRWASTRRRPFAALPISCWRTFNWPISATASPRSPWKSWPDDGPVTVSSMATDPARTRRRLCGRR